MADQLPVRVYYEDTDTGGVVYYANYLKFAERGRTELLRSLGFDHKSLKENAGLLFVVRQLEADYRAGARLDDLLMVDTAVVEIRNASFTMYQTVRRGDQVLFVMRVKLACVNVEGRPVRIPAGLKDVLAQRMEVKGLA